ncbi:MAG TPA: hypothetical protein VGW79_01615 [Actinomycetota bacterium]|nr:hypothetical protein [Actinomycetota bacterium]
MDIAQRLRALSAEIATLQTEIGILEEQIAFQTEIADDARIRALVSETPLADRESQEASGDLARMVRTRADALKRLEQLRADQDGLLERMLDERGKR